MANQYLPGNPYAAGVVRDISSDSVAVAKAIQLLAFEVRTANILAAASVVASVRPEEMEETAIELHTSLIGEAHVRLGDG